MRYSEKIALLTGCEAEEGGRGCLPSGKWETPVDDEVYWPEEEEFSFKEFVVGMCIRSLDLWVRI